jgi:hypothetical protein
VHSLSEEVEIRCPSGSQRLLAKVIQDGTVDVGPGTNLLEFACHDCVRQLKRSGHEVSRVLHRYNFVGQLVETVTRP